MTPTPTLADFTTIVKCDLALATFSLRGRPRLAVWTCQWCGVCFHTRLPSGATTDQLLADRTILPKPQCAIAVLLRKASAP